MNTRACPGPPSLLVAHFGPQWVCCRWRYNHIGNPTHPSQPVTRFNIFQVSPEPQGEVPITSGFQTLGILLQVPQQPLLEAEHSLLAVTHLSTHASVLFQRAVALNL